MDPIQIFGKKTTDFVPDLRVAFFRHPNLFNLRTTEPIENKLTRSKLSLGVNVSNLFVFHFIGGSLLDEPKLGIQEGEVVTCGCLRCFEFFSLKEP